jgi:hypothetical protein
VEIADIIDCDPEQVEPRLAEDIATGRMVVHQVIAPNGRSANGFEFSGDFQSSPAYVVIAAAAGVTVPCHGGKEVLEALPAIAPVAGKRPRGRPATSPPGPRAAKRRPKIGAPRLSYFARAIAFLRENGGHADNIALRNALGLGTNKSPISYLRAAVGDGRLRRAGNDWVIGDNGAGARRYQALAGSAPSAGEPASPAAPAFRCARWSDGAVELQRGGETIAVLMPDEQGVVMALLASAT